MNIFSQRNLEHFIILAGCLIILDPFALSDTGVFRSLILLLIAAIYGFSISKDAYNMKRINVVSIFVFILIIFALPGLIQNKLLSKESSLMTQLLLLCILPIMQRGSWDNLNLHRYLLYLSYSAVFSAFIGIVSQHAIFTVIHERSFLFVPMVIEIYYRRNLVYRVVSSAFLIFIMVMDPRSTTFIIVLLAFILPVLINLTRRSGKKPAILVIGTLVACTLYFAPKINTLYKDYYSRQDNTEFRLQLWTTAFEEFLTSPVYGNGFSGESSYSYDMPVNLPNAPLLLPAHNDFLSILASGGIIALLLYLLIFLCISRSLIYSIIASDFNKYNVMGIMCIVGVIICMLFNPVANNIRTGFLIVLVLSLVYRASQISFETERK